MEPAAYLPAYLERQYLASHPDLTSAARELLHAEVTKHPERYATSEHARVLLAYADVHNHMMRDLTGLDDLSDEEFERRQAKIFGEAQTTLAKLCEVDRLCVDAQCSKIMLADVPLDYCLRDLLALEERVRSYLCGAVEGFDPDAPHYWNERSLAEAGETAAERTVAEPEVIGWLHTLEAISQLCLASARYRAAARYARQVVRAEGYLTHAGGVLLLACARLEDEEGFFAAAHDLDGRLPSADNASAVGTIENSPWYLLGRAVLLYKLGREKSAQRALRDFSKRCEGGAFFLLNPIYLSPYLPVRPPVRHAWELSHQATWEADGIISDTPDFATWAADVPGISDASEEFARANGF